MFRELKRIRGILSDVGIMSQSDNPEEQEQAMFEAARELWEIVKPKIPSTLRGHAAQFWEQLEKLDVCDEFALVRLDVALKSLIESSNRYIPEEFRDFVVPHLGAIMRLIDRAKILARADTILRTSDKVDDDGDMWVCPKCQFSNGWKTCKCFSCGELSAPDHIVLYHSKLLTAIRHEIQGGSL